MGESLIMAASPKLIWDTKSMHATAFKISAISTKELTTFHYSYFSNICAPEM